MRDPPGEKKKWSCGGEIQGIICESGSMKKVTRVIERHYNHHSAPQNIERVNPLPGGKRSER